MKRIALAALIVLLFTLPGWTAHSVTLQWNPSTTPNVVYHVWRHYNSTFPPKPYANAGIDLTYTDANVTPGQTYYYWVTAYNKARGESAPDGPTVVQIPKD